MRLTNDFVVDAPVEVAWSLLTDVERIAPCVPGFELREIVGDEYRGTMKIKLGAVGMAYDSMLRFVERDDEHHRAVIAAEGRDSRGSGGVTARITSVLTPDGSKTKASISTDVSITGKIAQFGRGILADVSNRLIGQFVHNLETSLLGEPPTPAASDSPKPVSEGSDSAAPAGRQATPGASMDMRRPTPAATEPLDLIEVARGPIVKRVAPAAVLVVLLGLVLARRPRRR